MAILSDVPGIEVSIESKNQVLKEYGDNNEWSSRDNIKVPADRIALKYVQCESNAEFRIKIEISRLFKLTPSSNSITFWAEVDGRQIGGQSYLQIQLATGHLVDYIDVLAQRVSHTQVSTRPLKFCSIYTVDAVDSDRVKHDAKLAAAGLGEITVLVHRTLKGVSPAPPPVSRVKDYKPVIEIAEKALKGQALSHGVAFGEEKLIHHNHNATFIYPEGEKTPLGAFRFKYRSREALQSELIIPRSPSPSPPLRPLALRTDNSGNARRSKEERLARLKKEIDKIKMEEEDTLGGRKRGHDGSASSEKPYKTIYKRDGRVVVDLTDD